MTESDALLILNAVSGLGNARIQKIIDHSGSAADFLRLKDGEFKQFCNEHIIPPQILKNIQNFPKDNYLKKEYNLVQFHRVQLLTYKDADFPRLLKEIPDSPLLVYVKGNLKALNTPSIAMVGSRRASVYGLSMAEKFAGELAQAGVTIVSGLARGIDSACHRAALKAKGTTVAVFGCGLCHVFPQENKDLAKEISSAGALISEFSMETFPLPYHFPKRNRIVSGLSLGVVVVEASAKSGALITSDFALEQGREVFAIPGKVDQPNSQGVNRLIKEGAKLASCVEDILEELKLPFTGYIKNLSFPNVTKTFGDDSFETKTPKLNISEDEKPIYQQLSDEPQHIDDLAAQCQIPISKLMGILLKFELAGIVKQLPGKLFVRL